MKTQRVVSIGNLHTANNLPFTLFGGMNVIESRDMALRVAEHYQQVTTKLGIPWVFKASFDKANRSSLDSFRGPGLEEGLRILEEVGDTFGCPLVTDVHTPEQAAPAAEVVDVLQLPAFLARQTDLVAAMAATGKPLHIKKPQFVAPREMGHVVHKCEQAGNTQLILCERGTCFGYNNLVVDMLGFDTLKSFGYPVFLDVTHALQMPGGRVDSAAGRRSQVADLGRAGLSQGIAGLFLEAHPDPDQALCDGPCALRLDRLEGFLSQMRTVDHLIKSLPAFHNE